MYCRLEDSFFFFFFDVVKKIFRSATHRSTENFVLNGFRRHVALPGTVPHLSMADREFEISDW